MKNITVAVDEKVYRRARVAAAQRNTSVSRLVADYLSTLGKPERGETEALFNALDKANGFKASDRISRDRAHER